MINGDNDSINNVIVFLHDFFDSFIEYNYVIELILKKSPNYKILMLNFPGQAYTIFSKDKSYTNYYLTEMIDSLFYHLSFEKKIINPKKDVF